MAMFELLLLSTLVQTDRQTCIRTYAFTPIGNALAGYGLRTCMYIAPMTMQHAFAGIVHTRETRGFGSIHYW
eukprot:7962279-Ditylum_brightwellii.AAC.1